MRRILMIIAAAAPLALWGAGAQAFPIAPAGHIEAAPVITLVSGGCGPYRHRGPFGGCRPNFGPRFGGQRFYGHRSGRPHGFRGGSFHHRRFR